MRYVFIDAEKATESNPGGHSVTLMCKVLGVSRSGYYAYLAARPAAEEPGPPAVQHDAGGFADVAVVRADRDLVAGLEEVPSQVVQWVERAA
ncbi:hypothetical protein OH738_10130 [Streptomyces hirsutus]|uniref:IS3 family transposase n=1 Tax=Streptomyces hirsutus TaxID=35620 RepID=A0ABZ1GTD3_9ACTN|nr:hypothetical protein [Streptomyces hirsutus]WSD09451.1 hypothetical protein OIE73_29340 [Streptomyces hirsutus]WTD17098.1 hypothetical protein OH738_10130 [Streptomyces hirsutus]